ncbi:MAG: 30S ribosomal protein S21 [Flavobacteriaceae bacterium]|nr:30S ribosomal protein S21 [Bacteroidia bacterium]NNL16331.1 30S ribosomal protein S21 [Flavobacteriaceae bacterium]
MLKIEVKEGENIDRAIKRYRRKHRNVKLMQQIREHQQYTKKSEERRKTIKKAQYREQYLRELEV